jgi:hypothetical protein
MSLSVGSSSDANSKEEAWGIYQEILECINDSEKVGQKIIMGHLTYHI